MDVIFEYRGSEFEWDAEKAASNLRQHGVSFETACEVFFDPLARHGDASVETEQRNVIVGKTDPHLRRSVERLFCHELDAVFGACLAS